MEEHDELNELAAEINAIGREVDARLAAGVYGTDQYDELHRYEQAIDAWLRRSQEVLAENTRTMNELNEEVNSLRKSMTDMEAADFAKRLEHDMDLERWKDGIAADVGHDLEEIADEIMDVISASERGEDVTAALYGVHMDVVDVMADLLTMNPEDEEA